jgi:hypothetical protein
MRRERPSVTSPVNRYLFTRPDPHDIAQHDEPDGDIDLLTRSYNTRRPGLKAYETLYRLRGFAPGPHLERRTEVYECDYQGRRLEIKVSRDPGH